MNTPPRPLLAPGTPVRVLTQRHRNRVGEVVTGPTDGAWDDLVVWVDLGQSFPVPVLPHEILSVEHTTGHRVPAQQVGDTRTIRDAGADPVAAALESMHASWPADMRRHNPGDQV
jgi:hypothetical protein